MFWMQKIIIFIFCVFKVLQCTVGNYENVWNTVLPISILSLFLLNSSFECILLNNIYLIRLITGTTAICLDHKPALYSATSEPFILSATKCLCKAELIIQGITYWRWMVRSKLNLYSCRIGMHMLRYIKDLTYALITSWRKAIKCEACRAIYCFFATSSINSIIQEHQC